MLTFIYSLAALVAGGTLALLSGRSPRLSTLFGVGGALAGSALGLFSALPVLAGGPEISRSLPWGLPVGGFHIGMDALSAFFLLPIFVLSALAAVYGSEYMAAYHGKKPAGPHWFFFNVLTAGMALVVVARDGLLFLIAWEVMSLAPFFLVTFEDEKESVRSAGWTYLVAAHLGALPLLALFIILGSGSGSLDFDSFGLYGQTSGGLLFILALLGFGVKAGFVPLHVWLPEAHPAAPSHVSAVMSGVMIKTGIYGILRVLAIIGPPSLWWGESLVAVGLVSGIMGVLFASAQHDLKRLLAYSSVENVGIITLGIGLGLIGRTTGSAALAALGFGGAFFHVLNHAAFKGLLFLGAGSVLHSAGTVAMDRLGGLNKSMPLTSAAFLAGAVAISGLPPFNGFAGEFLIYLAGINGGLALDAWPLMASWLAFMGLALISGLAAVCFAKAYGGVFLGEARGGQGAAAHEAGPRMTGPMLALACACLLLGLFAPWVFSVIAPAVTVVTGGAPVTHGAFDAPAMLGRVTLVSAVLLALLALAALARKSLLAGRKTGATVTWDCGYADPAPRMQYTASSFTQPLTALMQPVLRISELFRPPVGFFPRAASYETGTPGGAVRYIYKPLFAWITSGFSRFRWIQHGRLNIYVLYIAVTLVVLLIWKI